MNGKMAKRLGVLALATALFLTGCGVGEKETTSKKSGSSIKVSGVNEFPIVEEPVTLTIFTEKNSNFLEDFNTNEFTKWYEEKTNVKINWDLTTGDVRQAINLRLASDDLPDIFLGFGFARSEQSAYYSQGAYIDISDLVEEHGYYIKQMFEKEPHIEPKLRHTEGMLLGLPSYTHSFETETPYKMWVYKPWMEKLGVEKPETTEQFYELLKRFKEEDPNGNGVADEIPLAARNGRGAEYGLDTFIMNAFVTWNKYGITLDENGDAIFCGIQEEAKVGIRYMRKLYKEGLIHPDSFIMDRARLTALGENEDPILGAATGRYTSQFTVAGAPSNRMNEFVAIAPLKGPNGLRQTFDYTGGDPGCTSFSITTSCEYPEVAIKWIDWFYVEESYLKTRAADGVRAAKKGELGLDGKQALFAIDEIEGSDTAGSVQNKRWLSTIVGYSPLEWSTSVKDNTIDAVRKKNSYEASTLYRPYAASDIILGDFPVPAEQAEEYLELRANTTSALDAGFVSFIIGEKDIEKDWDAYVKRFYDLGLERYLEIAQNYLDTQK